MFLGINLTIKMSSFLSLYSDVILNHFLTIRYAFIDMETEGKKEVEIDR